MSLRNQIIDTPDFIGNIESAQWRPNSAAAIVISGWTLCRESRPWVAIHASIFDRKIASAPPHERADVFAQFPDSPTNAASGFTLQLPRIETESNIDLWVEESTGDTHLVCTIPIVALAGRSAVLQVDRPLPVTRDPVPVLASRFPPDPPLFTVLLPVFNPVLHDLEECLKSLLSQTFPLWEARIVDDHSDSAEVTTLLDTFAQTDPRIKVTRLATNRGIADASNQGLAQAKGDWVVFLDHDDCLRPHALAAMAQVIGEPTAPDIVYSDEEKIAPDGSFRSLFLKPDWSPAFLRGVMYVGHLLGVRRSLLNQVGGLDPEFNGIQDYELMLRLSETNPDVRHIPQVLYQWRMAEKSSATVGNIKGDMDALQARAVQAHLARRGLTAKAVALSGHRACLIPPPDFEIPAFQRIQLPSERAWETLREIKDPSTAYVVVVSEAIDEMDDAAVATLLFNASVNHEAVFAPVLIAADELVVESGCTRDEYGHLIRIMRGYDPSADGYNGSLKCTREVFTHSGNVLVAHRDAWLRFLQWVRNAPSAPQTLAAALAESPLTPIVVADVAAKMKSRLLETQRCVGKIATCFPDPYWNPAFDPRFADYRLAIRHAPTELKFHFDHAIPSHTDDARISVRGWCLDAAGNAVAAAQVRIGDWIIPVQVGLPRPDVTAAFSSSCSERSGFETRFELPVGYHPIEFEVRCDPAAEWHPLASTAILVTPPDRRSDSPVHHESLIAFQLGLHPRHPPLPVKFTPFPRNAPTPAWPRLTVVTPSFQQGEFLPQTLDSVSENDLSGVEHIVRDGGSTDRSVPFLESHPAAHRRWVSAPDGGQAHAIKLGLADSTGAPEDLMAWINSDDFYTPGALDYVRSFFATNLDVDVLYGNRIVVNETGREINRWHLPPHSDAVLKLNDFVPQETLFWRRRIWEDVGGINPDFNFAMDWDLLLRFQAHGAKIVHVPAFLACFRVHASQKTSARMNDIGSVEIDRLRQRTWGRAFLATEIVNSPELINYLEHSHRLRQAAECTH